MTEFVPCWQATGLRLSFDLVNDQEFDSEGFVKLRALTFVILAISLMAPARAQLIAVDVRTIITQAELFQALDNDPFVIAQYSGKPDVGGSACKRASP